MFTAIATVAASLVTATAAYLGNRLLYKSKIEEIHHEVKHNSGRSMKDRSDQTVVMLMEANTKIDLLAEQVKGGFNTVNAKLDGHDSRLDTVEERLTTHERAEKK